jgi:predicted transcriptional regulator
VTAGKRSKVDIYTAVLECLCQEGGKLGKASPTRVAHKANVPYDRFQKILDHLIETQMVTRLCDGLCITKKGQKCLDHIHSTSEFLRRMGLV